MSRAQTFDGCNLRSADFTDPLLTTSDRRPIDVDSTSSTEPDSATIFGSCEIQAIAKHPQQRHFGLGIDAVRLAVYVEDKFRHTKLFQTSPAIVRGFCSSITSYARIDPSLRLFAAGKRFFAGKPGLSAADLTLVFQASEQLAPDWCQISVTFDS